MTENGFISEYIEDFIEYMRIERHGKNNTLDSYRRDLTHFAEFHGERRLDRVNATAIMAYMLALERDGRSPATVARRLSAIKTFFRYLLNSGTVKSDPAYKIKPPATDKPTPPDMGADAAKRLLRGNFGETPIDLRDKALLELMFATGVRPSEVAAMRVSDVHVLSRFVECGCSARRVVPIGAAAAAALAGYIGSARDALLGNAEGDALFITLRGAAFTRYSVWNVVKSRAKSAGLDESAVSPIALRHRFGSAMAENGADPESLREMMGHTHMKATQVYYGDARPRLKDVYESAMNRGE